MKCHYWLGDNQRHDPAITIDADLHGMLEITSCIVYSDKVHSNILSLSSQLTGV